jgi:hypothetical protein
VENSSNNTTNSREEAFVYVIYEAPGSSCTDTSPNTRIITNMGFLTHAIEAGYDICTVQELLGHKDVKTTMIFTACSTVPHRLFAVH